MFARAVVVAMATCAGVCAVAGPAAAEEGGEVEPIDLVVAVDESGSLSPTDVAQEKAAAATIALGELSAQSRVVVFGFASKGAKPAVESQRCVLKPGAGAADREAMGQCIQRNINRREAADGDDTDFVAALNQGIAEFSSGGDRPKVLFLLTDGQLDVRGDTSYGPNEAAQQQRAEHLLKNDVLPKAKQRGIQVWPLGFGAVDQTMLGYFAANGGRALCDGREVTPTATLVRDSGGARLLQAMHRAFAAARCGGSSFADPEALDPGGDVTLTVTIPAIATDGTITVYKADPKVVVTFTDPDGTTAPSSGEADGSTFELAGNSGTVEALRIRNPKPGHWKVKLAAPAEVTKQLVTASVLWQGVLRSVFFLDPPNPAPGQPFTVVMAPHTRSIEITDPKVLAGLSFTARFTGTGADTAVALLDDGKGPDAKAGDALYSASFQLPATASGKYTVRGVASGTGVASDEHSHIFEPGKDPVVNAQIVFDRGAVEAGTTRSGVVRVTNHGTTPRDVRLVIKDLAESGSVSASPTTVTVAPGRSEFIFSLAFAANARGPSGGALQLIDAASGDVVTNTPLGVTIEEPPPWWKAYLWWLIAGAVLLLTGHVLAAARLVTRRRGQDVRGLSFQLYHGDWPLRPQLSPEEHRRSDRFAFDIDVSPDGDVVTMRSNEAGSYSARRNGAGGVRVVGPFGGQPLEIATNGRPVDLPHLSGYALEVRDVGRIPEQRTGEQDIDYPEPVTTSYRGDADL